MPPLTRVARPPRSPRRDLGRSRHQLRRVLLSAPCASSCACSTTSLAKRSARIALPEQTRNVWHGYVTASDPGELYGYRVQGRYAPREGHALQPQQAADRPVRARHRRQDRLARADLRLPARQRERRTSRATSTTPRAACPSPSSSTTTSTGATTDRPNVPWSETVVYETHVKGISMRHPDVPKTCAGPISDWPASRSSNTCARSASRPSSCCRSTTSTTTSSCSTKTCRTTGATARSATSRPRRGTRRGDRGEQVTEFKAMVKRLHAAGLEVFLDVVYNHTAEGNHLGPTLTFRGLDNSDVLHS